MPVGFNVHSDVRVHVYECSQPRHVRERGVGESTLVSSATRTVGDCVHGTNGVGVAAG